MPGENTQEHREQQAGYYDRFVSRQQQAGVNERHRSIASKLVEHGLKPTDSVLEIGCGIGTVTGLLAGLVPDGEIQSIDLSSASIDVAIETHSRLTNVSFKVANAVTHEFGDSQFDTIVLPDVLEHIPLDQHSSLFRKLSGLVADDGFIFIHIPNPYYLEWCHTHRPDTLQIIDQPIFTDELVSNLYPHGLHISALQTSQFGSKRATISSSWSSRLANLNFRLQSPTPPH